MLYSTLLDDHCHNSILIGFSTFLVHAHNLVDANIAYKVAHNEDEIRSDETTSVDVAHGIAGREGFFGRHDGDDLHARTWLRPFGIPDARGYDEERLSVIQRTLSLALLETHGIV